MQNNENDSSSIYVFYKPDSQKVGTLYKLWVKKEWNNLEISNLYFIHNRI